jgi:hypothetical protein
LGIIQKLLVFFIVIKVLTLQFSPFTKITWRFVGISDLLIFFWLCCLRNLFEGAEHPKQRVAEFGYNGTSQNAYFSSMGLYPSV